MQIIVLNSRVIVKFMQNEILLVDSTRQDKQSTSLRVLSLLKIAKNKEVDLMSKTSISRIDLIIY